MMNINEFREYCLAKPETTEELPFDDNTLVFKVMGKMFALTSLKSWEEGDHSVNLKCDPQKSEMLRSEYPDDVFPGYHMNKKHWNTVNIDQTALSENYIRTLSKKLGLSIIQILLLPAHGKTKANISTKDSAFSAKAEESS
jgi:predicted DNA-binding protein (MmcQ/YjbR family)